MDEKITRKNKDRSLEVLVFLKQIDSSILFCKILSAARYNRLLTSLNNFLFVCNIEQINVKIDEKWHFHINRPELRTFCYVYLLKIFKQMKKNC